ncbi:MAG: hypothetical protein COA63_010750 [Methylophaga sp.]|nr:hypothetical protein [Methylophaga sp.]
MSNKNTHNTHDFKGLDDWFTAFQGGSQVDSKGNKKAWTEADLDQIVTNTQKRIDKNIYSGAPMVIGHPKADAPAYGWIGDIKRVGKTVAVKGSNLQDAFATGVKEGLWPNRSVSIGKDSSGYYLRHLGFLGAVPPAIEGMDSIYSASDDEHFDYSVDARTPGMLSRMMRRLREFLIDKYDVETADQVLPDYQINELSDIATQLREDNPDQLTPTFTQAPTGDDPMPEFSQKQMDEAVAKAVAKATEAANTASQADFAQKEQAAATLLKAETDKRLAVEFSADISTFIDDGKVLPAQAEGMANFMLQLSDADDASFEFSAGEGDKKETIKKSPLKWFQDFMASQGKQIDLEESDAGSDHETPSSDFETNGATVNADRLELHNKANEYMSTHGDVDYIEAVKIVEKQSI